MFYQYKVNHKKQVGQRIDKYIALNLREFSRSKIIQLIKSSNITVNNNIVDPDYKISLGDHISVNIQLANETPIIGENIKLNIVYEDKDLIVINKPAGIVMHPGAGNKTGTIVNALINHCGDELKFVGDAQRPGIVHRIDKDTSGLLVVAKNDQAHAFIAKQFEEHTIKRSYLVFVYGILRPLHGRIETLIGRNKTNRQKMSADVARGKEAITNYETLEVFKGSKILDISLVKCMLETGRTHQIRVHMSHKGNPILGDQTYGKKIKKLRGIDQEFEDILKSLKRQALHAHTLGFVHPKTNQDVFYTSELPEDLNKLKNRLETLKN